MAGWVFLIWGPESKNWGPGLRFAARYPGRPSDRAERSAWGSSSLHLPVRTARSSCTRSRPSRPEQTDLARAPTFLTATCSCSTQADRAAPVLRFVPYVDTVLSRLALALAVAIYHHHQPSHLRLAFAHLPFSASTRHTLSRLAQFRLLALALALALTITLELALLPTRSARRSCLEQTRDGTAKSRPAWYGCTCTVLIRYCRYPEVPVQYLYFVPGAAVHIYLLVVETRTRLPSFHHRGDLISSQSSRSSSKEASTCTCTSASTSTRSRLPSSCRSDYLCARV